MKTRQTLQLVALDQLRQHPGNIRDDIGDVTDLARSIVEHGILQPLVATNDPTHDNQLLLLAGHRRLAAAQHAHLEQVPVVIRHDLGHDDAEQVVVMLVENTQRRDLSPIEKANAYGALRNRGLTQAEIARRVGVTPATVSHYLMLLELDEATVADVSEGRVTAEDARAAIREVRDRHRRSTGTTATRGRPVVTEPGWFNSSHPLAAAAAQLCDHSTRPKLPPISRPGSTTPRACGQCWEQAIRTSEHDGARTSTNAETAKDKDG